jgi:hypothetical protein
MSSKCICTAPAGNLPHKTNQPHGLLDFGAAQNVLAILDLRQARKAAVYCLIALAR